MDNGIYICKATNKLNTEKAIGQLIVLRVLAFTVVPPTNITVMEGQHVFIDCQAANAIELNWIQAKGNTNTIVHSNGTLELTSVTSQNQGTYTCTARNAQREIKAETRVEIISKHPLSYLYHQNHFKITKLATLNEAEMLSACYL
jgi:hypothetical protein